MSIKIQKNILLSKYTSFKIGGVAKYFCVAENNDEIKEVLEFAEKNKLNVFVLGGGSNLLISDEGFDGLVIRIKNQELRIKNNRIIVGSGLSLAKLIGESVKNNLTGLECLAGIPGTVGGAIVDNVGAFGKCMKDVVKEVEILDIGNCQPEAGPPWAEKLETGKLNNKECQFKYRSSIFKEEKKYIILSAVLKLSKGDEAESRKVIKEYLKLRTEKQPLEYPNAGSVFKNPVVDDSHLAKLIKEYPELNKIAKNNTIPTGWLIEELGFKGKKIGGAMISEKHCNFIVNTGNAKAEDVVILISLIKQKIRSRFGIQLREEIEYVGF
ncbi:UDP-N-acetylmuramate dehydrogenase [Candidatus Parcubacteria bacterium]|nr:UDP-N-acetylmuramate dehydrogenase [Candidatus Parcubacteria bacterium]